MKSYQLTGQTRTDFGKKANKALRNAELIPCVIYGGKENSSFSISEKELNKVVFTPNTYLIDLSIDGNAKKAIVRDLQFHPVTDKVLHVDFLEIFEDKPVSMSIPVKLEGLAAGVKEGGKLNLEMRGLKVKGLYKDFPDTLDIDVSNLGLGKTIQVAELNFDNLEILNAANAVVAAVKLTRAARGARAAAAASS